MRAELLADTIIQTIAMPVLRSLGEGGEVRMQGLGMHSVILADTVVYEVSPSLSEPPSDGDLLGIRER
jgi:hypothetical protein